eukprot:196369_1
MKFQTAVLVVVALFAVQMIGECNASRFNMKAGSEKASGIELEHKKSKSKCFKPCDVDDHCKKGKCKEIQVGALRMSGNRCIGCADLPCDSSTDCCKKYACSEEGQCFRRKDTKKCGTTCENNSDCDGECPKCTSFTCRQEPLSDSEPSGPP